MSKILSIMLSSTFLAMSFPATAQPTAINDEAVTTANSLIIIPVLANDVPGTGGTLADVTVTRDPPNGRAYVLTDLTILYEPNEDYVGSDNLAYEVTDENNVAAVGVVEVTVEPRPVTDDPFLGCRIKLACPPYQCLWNMQGQIVCPSRVCNELEVVCD